MIGCAAVGRVDNQPRRIFSASGESPSVDLYNFGQLPPLVTVNFFA